MHQFPGGAQLRWFETPSGNNSELRAGIAHLSFLSILPFENGNGRNICAAPKKFRARSPAYLRRPVASAAAIARPWNELRKMVSPSATRCCGSLTVWVAPSLMAETETGQVRIKPRLWVMFDKKLQVHI